MSTQVMNTENANGEARKMYRKPNYEVTNRDNAYYVDVFMPGVSREDASITLDGETLTIEAKRLPFKQTDWKIIHGEIYEHDYRLELKLNVDIEPEGITAKTNDGILTVALPVAAKAAQRSIPIE